MSIASDVYSLGVILVELLIGQPLPKIEPNDNAIAVVQDALSSCDADEHLLEIARTCLAEDPNERFADAGVLEQELEEYFEIRRDSLKAAELQQARAETLAEVERKRRSFAVVASTLMLLLVAFSVVTGAIVAFQEHQKVLQTESRLVAATTFLADAPPAASQLSLDRTRHLIRELTTLPTLMLQRSNVPVANTITALTDRRHHLEEELQEARRISEMLTRFRRARHTLHQANVGSVADAAAQCIEQYDAAFRESGIEKGMSLAEATRLLCSEYCSNAQRDELVYGVHEWTLLTYFGRSRNEVDWHRQLCDQVDKNPVRKHVWKLVETNNVAQLKQVAQHHSICDDEVAVLLVSTLLNLKKRPELQTFRKQLLTRARVRHPRSFQITRELALHYLQSYPSKFTDAKAVDLLSCCLVLNPEFRDTFIEWIRILSYRGNHEF